MSTGAVVAATGGGGGGAKLIQQPSSPLAATPAVTRVRKTPPMNTGGGAEHVDMVQGT
jgi:hypothetical protein